MTPLRTLHFFFTFSCSLMSLISKEVLSSGDGANAWKRIDFFDNAQLGFAEWVNDLFT